MEQIVSQFTVFFEDPFWVGVYEGRSFEGYAVCKVVFGAELRDFEVYDMILKHFDRLRFRLSTEAEGKFCKTHRNPKRVQREIRKQLQDTGIGTRAQQALKRSYEQEKRSRKILLREQSDAEKERQFRLRQKKRKEKRRGH